MLQNRKFQRSRCEATTTTIYHTEKNCLFLEANLLVISISDLARDCRNRRRQLLNEISKQRSHLVRNVGYRIFISLFLVSSGRFRFFFVILMSQHLSSQMERVAGWSGFFFASLIFFVAFCLSYTILIVFATFSIFHQSFNSQFSCHSQCQFSFS
jgi:hypothetical protein